MDGKTTTGVRQARELIAFADAVLGRDRTALDLARAEVVDALGPDAMIDAAAVIAGFDGITRIADATGIPLEPPKAEQTVDLRTEMKIDQFLAAKW